MIPLPKDEEAALKDSIFEAIPVRGAGGEGLTCDGVQVALGISSTSISVLLLELLEEGVISAYREPYTGRNVYVRYSFPDSKSPKATLKDTPRTKRRRSIG